MAAIPPLGIRNNNPGNIEWGSPWQGLATRIPNDKDTRRFAKFTKPVYGIRAIAVTLITYFDKHGIRTVAGAINRWAPPTENVTSSYVKEVARAVGVPAEQEIDFHDYRFLRPMVEAIIRHENGVGPLKTANTWYKSDVIEEAMRRAGVLPSTPTVANIPVTKETVGATGAAGLGVAQLADVAPQIAAALDSANPHISSGSWVRIAFGILTIVVSVYIAYSQVKKHQQGSL